MDNKLGGEDLGDKIKDDWNGVVKHVTIDEHINRSMIVIMAMVLDLLFVK